MSMRMDLSSWEDGLETLEQRADAAIRMLCEQGALKLKADAQRNARWADRTGAARQRLNAGVEDIDTAYRLYLAHGVDYGIWLELAHEKKFSIIPDTIRYTGTMEILPAFNHLLERL